MSKRTARDAQFMVRGYHNSIPRCAVAILLVVLGIAWMVVYLHVAKDAALYDPKLGGTKPSTPFPWMSDMKRWNFVIGFMLIFAGMTVAAHKNTPLGRGNGVVVGMLFSFLFGLIYIVVYYFLGQNLSKVPLMSDLDAYNLLVGVGFMAVGFTYATKWE